VLNPLWTGHARLHTVWLLATNSLVCLIALGILWRGAREDLRRRIQLAATLVACVLGGFFIAAATQAFYGGSLADSNDAALRFGPFNANLAAFSILLVVLGIASVLTRRPEV